MDLNIFGRFLAIATIIITETQTIPSLPVVTSSSWLLIPLDITLEASHSFLVIWHYKTSQLILYISWLRSETGHYPKKPWEQNWFLEKTNEINKPPSRLIKDKAINTYMNIKKKLKGNITMITTEILELNIGCSGTNICWMDMCIKCIIF